MLTLPLELGLEKILIRNEKVKELHLLATEQNNADAQLEIGLLYIREVPRDFDEGAHWIQKAAEQNNADAQGILGILYARGLGVSKDIVEAKRWYLLAAEQGNARAQVNLGRMYEEGDGVLKDKREALRWYQLAAEQGDVLAQLFLGQMYADYFKDYVLGHMWLNISSANGNLVAGIFRDNYENSMTRDQIHRATEMAQACMESNYKTCER